MREHVCAARAIACLRMRDKWKEQPHTSAHTICAQFSVSLILCDNATLFIIPFFNYPAVVDTDAKSAVSRQAGWRVLSRSVSDRRWRAIKRAQAPLNYGRQQLDTSGGCCDERICCRNEVWFSLGGRPNHIAHIEAMQSLPCKHKITWCLATRLSATAPHCLPGLSHRQHQWGCTKGHQRG
jgi:hypothetical protein